MGALSNVAGSKANSPVEQELSSLDNSLNALKQGFDEFESKIGQYLRPVPPAPASSATASIVQPSASYATEYIRERAALAENLYSRLCQLTQRFEG